MVVTAGFGVPYLKSLGMSNTEVGQIMAWTMVAGIVGQFVMGYVCDLKKTIKKSVYSTDCSICNNHNLYVFLQVH